jgi:mRNA interferase RelE/StbE
VADYTLRITTSAQKELDGFEDSLFARIDRNILALSKNPRPAGCKKLKGHRDVWRIRVGDWWVVYLVDDADERVTVTRVSHRRDAYRD